MFFWEDDVDESIIRNEGSLESRGNFTPHNLDINWTYFNVFNERSYSRWRFHFLFVLNLLLLISTFYPIIFIIAFMEVSIWIGSSQSDEEWMTEDYFFDYKLYLSQIKGGDARLNIYVFVYYDRLGYVIYGLSDIGMDYCEDLFQYNDLLGLNNNINNYIPILKSKYSKKINIRLYDDNLINISDKYVYIYRDIDITTITNTNHEIIKLLKKHNFLNKSYHIIYNYIFNNDRSITWVEYNNLLKKFKSFR